MEPAPKGDPSADEPAQRRGTGRNLPLAIVTGLSLVGLLFGTIFWGPTPFFVLVAVVLLIAQYELYTVLARRGYRPATLLGLAGGALVLAGAHWRGPQALSFGLVLTIIGAFLWYLVEPNRDGVATNVALTVFGVVYVPVLGAHAVLMRRLPDGIALTLAFIGIVALYDVGAYATGSWLGRHKLAPSVSPSKTWEGTLGATAFVFLLALVIGPHLGPLSTGSALLLAAAASITAPLGDLAESMLKRDLGVKDMGTLLPGHGGALDRVDALLFSAPAAYWIYRVIVL